MQSAYPKLNFPPIKLKTCRNTTNNTLSVWVATRRCYLILTPEEWVRRHTVAFLTSHCKIEPTQICEEYLVKISGQPQRADIVVIGTNGLPSMLIECKAASVSIDQAVFDQAVRYNSVVGARYIVLTNGLKHFCYEHKENLYTPLQEFPQF